MNEEHEVTLILAILTPIIGGIGWWIRTMVQRATAVALARREDKLNDLRKIEALQMKIESMLQERIADEANKRREADTSVKLMTEMTVLLRTALAKEPR